MSKVIPNGLNWEHIGDKTQRAKVFGGWVLWKYDYAGTIWIDGNDNDIEMTCMVFIPDPDHRWEYEHIDMGGSE